MSTKRTFQPSNRKRSRKHGFTTRMATKAGRAMLKHHHLKKRKHLSA